MEEQVEVLEESQESKKLICTLISEETIDGERVFMMSCVEEAKEAKQAEEPAGEAETAPVESEGAETPTEEPLSD